MNATSFLFLLILLYLGIFHWLLSNTLLKNTSVVTKHLPFCIQNSQKKEQIKKNAYVFLLGNVDPDSPESYRGFLYNILVSTYILRMEGSKADIVMLLHYKENVSTLLPDDELRILEQMKIIVQVLTDSRSYHLSHSNTDFEKVIMLKFHVFNMTQYNRIMFLDSDVMPLCNIDYIFDLSMVLPNPIIKPNLIFSGQEEPTNGGLWMIEPSCEDYDRIQRIIDRRFEKPFDPIIGWGHCIDDNDKWQNRDGMFSGTRWDFYCAHVDQGLLYHWMRYEKGTYSVVYPKPDGEDFSLKADRTEAELQNWKDGKLESSTPITDFSKFSCLPRHLKKNKDLRYVNRMWSKSGWYNFPFHSDLIHYMAWSKPWNYKVPKQQFLQGRHTARQGKDYWFYVLKQLDQMYQMKINYDDFGKLWQRQSFFAEKTNPQ